MRRPLVLVLAVLAFGAALEVTGPASATVTLPGVFARQIAAVNRVPAAPPASAAGPRVDASTP